MGSGSFDSGSYYSAKATRAASGVDDFHYSKTSHSVHDDLKPSRINSKVHGVLESRDSVDHPESNAIIVCFDVTGSNMARAVEAQKALPGLMTLLEKYITDPQISVAANDDFYVEPDRCFQMSEFESDNRIDDHIRNVKIVGNGGGNSQESYDLILYAARYKTITDCYEKRGKKGYLFLYADEPIPKFLQKSEVKAVFGDNIDTNVPIEQLIAECREKWEIFVMWPAMSSYDSAYDQYVRLFGSDYVIALEHPNRIAEMIGATIGINEGKIDAATAVDDLVAVGVTTSHATAMSASLAKLSSNKAVGKINDGELEIGGSGAHRF